MAFRSVLFLGTLSLLLSSCMGQFGVAGKNKPKKRGTSFEEIQEMAKERNSGPGTMGMDAFGNMESLENLAGMDVNDINKLVKDAMKDPEMVEMMQKWNTEAESAMSQLAEMSPEQLAQQMKQAMELMTSEEMIDSMLQNKDEVIQNLAASGMIPPEALEEFKNNPEKLETELKTAMKNMNQMFEDPETLKAATEIAKGMTDAMQNPEKFAQSMASAMAELSKNLEQELSDDDKIEEARLQLLANPDLAGNPALASVYNTEEMKEILNDPVKWRESVKKGQNMLLGGQGAAVKDM